MILINILLEKSNSFHDNSLKTSDFFEIDIFSSLGHVKILCEIFIDCAIL